MFRSCSTAADVLSLGSDPSFVASCRVQATRRAKPSPSMPWPTAPMAMLADHRSTPRPTSGLAISYQVISGPAMHRGQFLTITGAGLVTIEAIPSRRRCVLLCRNSCRPVLHGEQAQLTVAADNLARVFGQANPAFTATITGFVNGRNAGQQRRSSATPTSAATTRPPARWNSTQSLSRSGHR